MPLRVRLIRWCAVWIVCLAWLGGPSPADAAPSVGPSVRPSSPADSASARPARGVVWTPPERYGPAVRTLRRMHARGVTAVRLTRAVDLPGLYAEADSLRMQLYVDLPPAYASADRLLSLQDRTRRDLERVADLARRHPSIRHVGLARNADTSTSRACAYFRTLTATARAMDVEGLQTYYVTPFEATTDRCRDAVDRVLLDVRSADDPVARWRAWADAGPPVGIGALGTWSREDRGRGLQVPHSPEAQARHLETALTTVLRIDSARLPVVFVYRWRDRSDAGSLPHAYGLLSDDGTPRPAAHVVTGLYTGRQSVFAFPAGTPPPSRMPWLIVLGWAVPALLGLLAARVPAFRRGVSRYFTAHGFYRDAVREGRETLGDVNAVLLILVATAVGACSAVAARTVAPLPATAFVLEALPAPLPSTAATWMTLPDLVGVGVGLAVVALLALWGLVLFATVRRTTPFSMTQAMMLVTWPCWPALPLMALALVAGTQPPAEAVHSMGVLVGVGIAAGLWTVGRVLADVRAVASLPGVALAGLALLSPPVLLFSTATAVLFQINAPLRYLWHLATRT